MAYRQTRVEIPFVKTPAVHLSFENGFQLVHVPRKGDVFNISTWVKTGSIHENDVNNGVSHFLEHLMFKGTARFGPGAFDKAMESMGAIINAATWKDYTFYYITGPKGSQNKNFETALDMHADMMLFSTLPDTEIGEPYDPDGAIQPAVKRERAVVIEEIGMREDQPWTKLYNSLNHMMYPEGHPYQRDVIGSRQIIGTIPRAEITDYYTRWYGPHTFTTVIVGDFETAWLIEQVQRCFDFAKQPNTGQTQIPLQSLDWAPPAVDHEALTADLNTAFLMLGFHGPKAADLKATIAVDVASRVLGEGRMSRLYQTFIEKPDAPVFNTISSGQSTFRLGNTFYVHGNFNSLDANGMLASVKDEIHRFVNESPVTAEEFTRVVKNMKANFAETSETASGIAESLGEIMTTTDSFAGYVDYLPVLESLTLDEVHQAARRWFDLTRAYSTTLVPKEALS